MKLQRAYEKIIKEKFQGLVVMFSIIIIAHISLGHTLKGMLKMTQQVTRSFKEQEPDMISYSKKILHMIRLHS